MYVPAVVSVGYYFDKRRALATGFVCSGSGAGTFILAPLASFLLYQLGSWRGAMKVFAGLCLFCALCGLTMKPLPKRPVKKEEEEDSEAQNTESKPNCLMTIIEQSCSPKLLTNLPFMLLTLSNLFATQGLYIPYMFLPSLATSKGIDTVNAAFLISIVGISNTICRILSGWLTDLPGVSALVVTFIALGRNFNMRLERVVHYYCLQGLEVLLLWPCPSVDRTGASSSSPSCSAPSSPPGAPSPLRPLSRCAASTSSPQALEPSPSSEALPLSWVRL